MKGLSQIMRVSWTAKKTNLWVLQQAGVEQSLVQSIKERKLKYCGHVLWKQEESLEKDILEGTMPGTWRRGRPKISWRDNIGDWTGMSRRKCCQLYKTVTDGEELFTMQPNFGAKMVKTRQDLASQM